MLAIRLATSGATPAAAIASMRVFSTSSVTAAGPTYTYQSPGSSIKDPLLLNVDPPGMQSSLHTQAPEQPQPEQQESQPAGPVKRPNLSKLKKVPRAKLEPQANSSLQGYLPSGCSIKDPSYSVRDPVYFTDSTSKRK